jgi:hypothetical protein
MAIDEATIPPFEIAIHICPLCRQHIASGLDSNGLVATCNGCLWDVDHLREILGVRPKRYRSGWAPIPRKRRYGS